MLTVRQAYKVWPACGYLATVTSIALLPADASVGAGWLWFIKLNAALAIPFVLSLALTTKIFRSALQAAKTRAKLICLHIAAGFVVASFIVLVVSLVTGIYLVIDSKNGANAFDEVSYLVIVVTPVAFMFAAIPVVIVGTLLALKVYSERTADEKTTKLCWPKPAKGTMAALTLLLKSFDNRCAGRRRTYQCVRA